MDADAHRHINTSSDSELLLNVFANNLQKTGKFRINEEDIFTAVGGLMDQCKGAYACVAMLAGFGIIAFRDPNGIRPVGMGVRRVEGGGKDYMIASESVVADAAGFGEWEDVKPGAVSITNLLRHHFWQLVQGRLSLLPAHRCASDKYTHPLSSLLTYLSMFTLRGQIRSWMASVCIVVGWQWATCWQKKFDVCSLKGNYPLMLLFQCALTHMLR